MPTPGDVVLVPFPGATGVKERPSVVVSSSLYHSCRPDVILGLINFITLDVRIVIFQIGALATRDWAEIQARLRLALAIT